MNKDKKRAILYAQNKKDFELFLKKMRKTQSNDFSHFVRKIRPFFKTSILGNTLSIRFKYSDNACLLILHANENSVFETSNIMTEVKTSKNSNVNYLIHAQNFQELLRKLTYRYNLFFNEA